MNSLETLNRFHIFSFSLQITVRMLHECFTCCEYTWSNYYQYQYECNLSLYPVSKKERKTALFADDCNFLEMRDVDNFW